MKISQPCFKASFFRYLLFGLIFNLLFSTVPVTASDRSAVNLAQNSTQEPDNSSGNQAQPLPTYQPPLLAGAEFRRLASRGGTSGRSRAGTRGDCPAVNSSPNLTAIVPLAEGTPDSTGVEMAIGTTTAAYPTFWFYLPYEADKIHSIQFVVNDDQDMPLFPPITVPLNHAVPGLVSIQLPSSSSPLEVGKYYRWYVMLDCSPQGGSDAFIDAFVERIELAPNVTAQLEAASPIDRVNLLLENGVWHDAFSELYALQMRSSNNAGIRAAWSKILTLGGITAQGSN